MESESDEEFVLTPPNIRHEAENVTENLLPEKSKELYIKRYDLFVEWCKKNCGGTVRISENVILVYLSQQAQVCSPSYLWTIYSMLKATIIVKHNIDISNFTKVGAFLKKKNVGYQPKKSKTFTKEEVNKFLLNAPDEQYLLKKVALIFGICGACRMGELCNMTVSDIEDKDSILIVNVPDSKTNKGRVFTVINGTQRDIDYLYYFRKYLNLRPKTTKSPRLFLSFKNGRCYNQAMGKNSLGKIPMSIAQYLQLPNPNLYTGHALRRTSATLLVNAGGTMTQLKRHGGWKSTTVAEGYIEESIGNKIQTANRILNQTTSNIDLNHTSSGPMPVATTHQLQSSSSDVDETSTRPMPVAATHQFQSSSSDVDETSTRPMPVATTHQFQSSSSDVDETSTRPMPVATTHQLQSSSSDVDHTSTRPMPVAATHQFQSSSVLSTPNTVFQNCDGCTITINNYYQK